MSLKSLPAYKILFGKSYSEWLSKRNFFNFVKIFMSRISHESFFPTSFCVRLYQTSLVQLVAKKIFECWAMFKNALKNLYGFSRSLIGRIAKPRPTLVTLLMAKLEAEAAAQAASDLTSRIAEALNQERSKAALLRKSKLKEFLT